MTRLFSFLFLLTGLVTFAQKDSLVLESISALTFANDGRILIGDALAGKVYAVDLSDAQISDFSEALSVGNLELQVGALLGTSESNILIHDMAVNPLSKNIYLSVSRGRAQWTSKWHLPNDLAPAQTLVKITPTGEFSLVDLSNVSFTSLTLPNSIKEGYHRWKEGVENRVDAITDLDCKNGKLYISGLSNEEFKAALWVADYPFKGSPLANSLEIYHGAHGKWETHAPIRAFLPYGTDDKEMMLAAYLCTPLVTFEPKAIEKAGHVKGRTVAEFGSGNYPLDMVSYQLKGKNLILMSNSQLPLLVFDPEDVANFEGDIQTKVTSYLAGVRYTPKSGAGVQELEDFNDKYLLATQRMPGGQLALISLNKGWLIN